MTKHMTRWLFVLAWAIGIAGAAQAQQAAPELSLTLIVPYRAGGGVDLIARETAAALAKELGSPVDVKNLAGRGGVTAIESVAGAAPDGSTLIVVNPATVAINPALYNMKIDPATALVPVARIAQTQLIGIVPTSSPAQTFQEFLDLARKYPASYNYGSGGTGNINNLGVELLKLKTGTKFAHTPAKNSSESIEFLTIGAVQFMMDGLHTTGKFIEEGKLRPLVVFGDTRLPALPDVPTAVEAGLPGGLSVTSWYGLAVPAGTPAAVVERLQKATADALATQEFEKWLAAHGMEPAFLTSDNFRNFIASERRRWGEVVRASGAREMLERVAAVPRGMGPDRIPLEPTPTKKFAVHGDLAYLGGQEIKIWGVRAANALMSTAVTERIVRNLDNMADHGLNGVLVYIEGSNTGWPLEWGARSGFETGGVLKKTVAERLEWLIREADKRGIVVGVGVFTPRMLPKDENGEVTEAVLKYALQDVGRFLVERKLRNVFIDLMHEYGHNRVDVELLKEPNGVEKKAKLAAWFHEVAPDYFTGVCGTIRISDRPDFPGVNNIQIIQKEVHIPAKGYVINCEMHKRDNYDTEGIYSAKGYQQMFAWWEQYKMAPNAGFFLHSGFTQGVTGSDGAAPYGEMGGYGATAEDRGIRVYYEWIRDNYGRWVYPKHVPVKKGGSR